MRTVRENAGVFSQIRGAHALINCPHGFGDWVFLSYVLPLLHPSNRYFVTRSGDHNVSVLDGCTAAQLFYSGRNPIGREAFYGTEQCPSEKLNCSDTFAEMNVELPPALHEKCRRHGIEVFLDLEFLEPNGFQSFPWHTKARFLAGKLVDEKRIKDFDLGKPLPHCLSFSPPDFVTQWVESRLRNLTGWEGRKLCVIARNGYTCPEKNWGHLWREDLPKGEAREGEECRQFMRLMRQHDPEWLFVIMEDRMFQGEDTVRSRADRCWSYAELFGEAETCAMPFGLAVKALLNCADLTVGVPTGPFHLAMAKSGLPTIGLWMQHFPSWTDEPRVDSVHLLSKNLVDTGITSRPGSFSRRAGLYYKTHQLATRIIPAEAVFAAAGEVLGWPTARIMPYSKARTSRRMIAVTIATRKNDLSHMDTAVRSCHASTSLDVFTFGKEAVGRYGLSETGHLIFKIFEEFPEAEAVLLFDPDVRFARSFDPIPFSDCRSVVGAAAPIAGSSSRSVVQWSDTEEGGIFSTRFLILNRTHHRELLAEAEQLATKGRKRVSHQAALNAARAKLDIPFYSLGWQFDPDAKGMGEENDRKVLVSITPSATTRRRKLVGAQ